MGILSFIGWVLLLTFLAISVLKILKVKSPIADIKGKSVGIALLLALVLITSDGLFFLAKPGTAYAVQYPWGGDKAITSQGVKAKLFGRLIPISFEIAIQDTLGKMEAQDEIYYRSAEVKEFADAIKARISTSIVIGVNYHDEEEFLNTADRNRSEEKLVYARIVPTYDQALKNTCKLLDAQDYISGAASQFDYYLRDQLEHGMYLTEEVYSEEEEIPVTDSLQRKIEAKSNKRRQKKYIIKMKNGLPVRDTSNSLHKYGLTVIQAAVTAIDWESTFDDRLDDQKKQVAETQLEKQKAEKEYYAGQAAIQKGEREKIEEQKKLEKEQITKIIAAETAAKQAEWKVVEEANLLAASKKTAERIRVESEANALKNARLVAAGLTPQERADWDYKTAIGVASAIAGPDGLKLPGTYVGGGEGKAGGSLLETLIGAELAKQMMNKP